MEQAKATVQASGRSLRPYGGAECLGARTLGLIRDFGFAQNRLPCLRLFFCCSPSLLLYIMCIYSIYTCMNPMPFGSSRLFLLSTILIQSHSGSANGSTEVRGIRHCCAILAPQWCTSFTPLQCEQRLPPSTGCFNRNNYNTKNS